MKFTDKSNNTYNFSFFTEFVDWYYSHTQQKLNHYFAKSELRRMFQTIEEEDFVEEKYLMKSLDKI